MAADLSFWQFPRYRLLSRLLPFAAAGDGDVDHALRRKDAETRVRSRSGAKPLLGYRAIRPTWSKRRAYRGPGEEVVAGIFTGPSSLLVPTRTGESH